MMNLSDSKQGREEPGVGQRVYCILSDERVFLTKSPPMFNSALRYAGINGVYVPFMVQSEKLGMAIESLRILNMAGANITVPYKEKAIPHIDILSEGANIIQAINTITLEKGVIKGFNTNAIGFMNALEEVGYDPKKKAALVFGTGGAARAAVFILNWIQAEPIFVVGRHLEKAQKLTSDLGGHAMSLEDVSTEKLKASLVVNATSVSSPGESPEMARLVEGLEVKNCSWVVDLNYDRQTNFWRDWAQKMGYRFMDGIPMLAHQASRSFALWTKIQVPPAVFLSGV